MTAAMQESVRRQMELGARTRHVAGADGHLLGIPTNFGYIAHAVKQSISDRAS